MRRIEHWIGRQRFREAGRRALGFAALLQQQAEVVVGLGKIRTQAQRLAVELFGEVFAPLIAIAVAKVETRRRVAPGSRTVGGLQSRFGFVTTVHILQRKPQIDVHLGRIDTVGDRPRQGLDGLTRTPLGPQDFAVQDVHLGNVRRQCRQRVVGRPCLRGLLAAEQRQRQVETGIDMARIEGDRVFIGRDRLGPAPQCGQHDAPVVVIRHTAGVEGAQRPHQLDRFGCPLLPVQDLREQMQGLLVACIGTQQFARDALGREEIVRGKRGRKLRQSRLPTRVTGSEIHEFTCTEKGCVRWPPERVAPCARSLAGRPNQRHGFPPP